MKVSLLADLRCPLCRSLLQIEEACATETIETGALQCTGCGECYPIEAAIPNFLSPRLPRYAEKARELQGWLALSQAEGWYEPDPVVDLALPDVVGKLGWDLVTASSWLGTAYSFQHMVEGYIRPGMKILEVGAAKTWAGAPLVQRGCHYTGFDMVTDAKIGIGRSRFYQAHHQVTYTVVGGDAEFLPFANECFDLVFTVAALHHALELPQMVSELARVTKQGGIVAGLNEGVRSYWAPAENADQAKEKTYGINEHSYRLVDYYRAFRQADLHVCQVTQSTQYQVFLPPRWQWLLRTIAALPGRGDRLAIALLVNFLHRYEGLTLYGQKR
ncbi:MAG: methyltransferase domain-containing protein [Caldilineaceae bacterium]|nr:methyltransferase domain-containing protein [Caldilineaceae bacterium]